MAGHTEFQSEAQLTEGTDVIIGNRICRQKLLLVDNVTLSHVSPVRTAYRSNNILFVEELVKRGPSINETDTAKTIRSKATERISRGQSG